MLRRLVRSYYRLRYFPRHLMEMLTGLSNAIASLHRHEAEVISQLMSAHEQQLATVHEEFVAFCDDAIRAMMTVSTGIADTNTRIAAVQHRLQCLDNAAVDGEARMASVQQSLQRLQDHDQGVLEQAGQELTGQAAPRTIAALTELAQRQAAQIDRIEQLLTQQARPLSARAPVPEAYPAKISAPNGPGEAAEDDARLSRV